MRVHISSVFIALLSIIVLLPAYAAADNGTVWTWGYNYDGQLGDGTTTDRWTPVQVPDLTGVTAAAGGDGHTIILKDDDTVWSWGGNGYGQLGDGTNTWRNSPVPAADLTGVTAIAGGFSHSLALKNDGTVWAWGYNYDGELGDGTNTDSWTPVQVSDLTGITAIAAGYYHTIALKDDGTVRAWGWNSSGQLGDDSTTDSWTPVQVSDLTGVMAIAGGFSHSLALKNDGTVWAWGYNYDGELGDGTNTDSWTPVQVSDLTGITAIAAGYYHSIALKDDGTVWTWGNNWYGQLGDDSTTDSWTPVQVSGLSGITAITGAAYHSIALKDDGTVRTWGYNYDGELGDNTNEDRWTPVQTQDMSGATGVAAGLWHTIALKGGAPDTTDPASLVIAPFNFENITAMGYAVSGTATDGSGSGVESVEVSMDGGESWSAASDTSAFGNWSSWSYAWAIPAPGSYNIKSRATDAASNVETPGAGVDVTVYALGEPELNHTDWDAWFAGGQCSACHETVTTFLDSGFRQEPDFCRSCHNAAGAAHDRGLAGAAGHSVFVSVTSSGCTFPTYGNITSADCDNRPYAHLYDSDKVVCVTCHNPMGKYEDFGRVFEQATSIDKLTYYLPDGGWDGLRHYTPRVYRSYSKWSSPPYSPTYSRDKKDYLVDPSEYVFNPISGTVTFTGSQDPLLYVFVTLDYPYLRAGNGANNLCSDCHSEQSHAPSGKGLNCLDCHEVHNTSNIMLVREKILPPTAYGQGTRGVVFSRYTGMNSFADGDATYDGICEVCHTQTKYYKNYTTVFANHSGGANYDGADCTTCHTHASGFGLP